MESGFYLYTLHGYHSGDSRITAFGLHPGYTCYTQPKAPRRLGEAKGLIEIKPDFDQVPDEFIPHFT